MKDDMIVVNFRVAVKAFIIQKDKLFVIKRAKDDIQSPGIWEIPGGRLNLGEDPILGLMREIREETGMYINPIYPLSVRHFKRSDNQTITMLIFLCKPVRGGKLTLSKEHSDYKWIDVDKEKQLLSDFFYPEVDIFSELNLREVM